MGHDTSLIAQNTPLCLRALPQWLVWRADVVNGRPTKVPYDVKTGRKASSTDPATWTIFEKAIECYAQGDHYDGIGFVFTANDPFCGIDLDDCIGDYRALAPWAHDILIQFPTYAEVSPSGRGLKVFLRGRKPDFAQCSKKAIDPHGGPGELELYDRSRYFTVTGNVWPGSVPAVTDCQAALDELCRRLWPSHPQPVDRAARLRTTDTSMADCLASMLAIRHPDGNDGSFRLFTVCCRCVEHDLSDGQALSCIRTYAGLRPFPTDWTDAEIVKRLRHAERRVRRGAALAHPVDFGGYVLPPTDENDPRLVRVDDAAPNFKSVRELLVEYPELRRPVVHGLLREGETMNIIAPPKTGKSWLVLDLALAVATGRPWLERFETVKGNVLILDNELHGETSANRVPKVAAARGIPLAEIADTVFIENLRGHLRDIFALGPYFDAIEPGRFKVVVVDAAYRVLPRDADENSNAQMAQVYNCIDGFADRLKCSFALVHHASKGAQAGKSVTDVGAGAGSQSRAADSHLVLRPHEQDGVLVLDAAVRSWPPIASMCLRQVFPIWIPALDLDPTALRRESSRRTKAAERQPDAPPAPVWDTDRFVSEFIAPDPRTRATVLEAAEKAGLSVRRAETLLRRAVEVRKAHAWKFASNQPVRYATVEQPLIDMPVPDGKKKRSRK